MKKVCYCLLFFMIVLIIIPLIIVLIIGQINIVQKGDSSKIKVYIADKDTVETMSIKDYLIGVVSAEMPANFEAEALKAQAVAARSYTFKKLEKPSSDSHKGANICTDSTHCQAWISKEKSEENWGGESSQKYKKIEDAVTKTKDEVVKYKDSIANTVFFSTSSGMTENASDVWGEHIDYLVSVESPGEELSPRYKSEASISLTDFKGKIEKEYKDTDWSKGLIENITRSTAGGIKSADVGGVNISGTKLRSIFGLRSTNFAIREEDQTIYFDVTGNGHGVGMSQYGANYMASQGNDYRSILIHYYSGTKVEKI